jgi:hypothetical protein
MKKILTLFLFIASLSIGAQNNGGVGHDTIPRIATKSLYQNVNFTEHMQDDFNGDNHPDQLICNTTTISGKRRINVQVKDGKSNRDIFIWRWTEANTNLKNGNKLIITGCDIVYLRPNRPSIILSTAYAHPTSGVRVIAPQFIMFNRPSDNRLVAQHIYIPGTNTFFKSAARSVKCTQVPTRLRQAGARDGALCFYAGYDSNLQFGLGYGTATALVKFEQGSGNQFIVKDLTASSNLPWSGGMKGTRLSQIRQVRLCSGARKYDGLHMMGGAFVDFNKDGLIDLVTVGQHASIRSHQMIVSNSKPEKFYFSTSYISDVQKDGMSEFLKIISLDENEKFANSSCVYVSGEKYNGCGSVPDHMRCFKNGRWETSYPEGKRFSSAGRFVSVKSDGKGKLLINAPEIVNGIQASTKYFYLNGAFEKKIVMHVEKLLKSTTTLTVTGWACVPNTGWRPRITISNKSHHSQKGYNKYYQRLVDIKSERMLMRRCMQPNSYPLRFKASIPKRELTSTKGTLYIQADFYNNPTINMSHVQRNVNY